MLFDPNSEELPKRKDLPQVEGTPAGAAWFWGHDDELGRINLLTEKRVKAATKLIQQGKTINLDWAAELPNPPVFGREPFQMKIKQVTNSVFDDLYDMNTQSGSQWDGFRHVNLMRTADIGKLSSREIQETSRCGMQAWAKHGIVGRGVLIDYWHYTGGNYDPMKTHRITLSDILDCAKKQGTTFKYGDILIIRSGFVQTYENMTTEEQVQLGSVPPTECTFVGVEQTPEMLDFLHDNYFSAVAGDAPAFEAWPTNQSWMNHEYLLSLWGVPIGEMWDLEALSKMCRETNRYEFFFSSSPSNVSGKQRKAKFIPKVR
ncbi:hypothetical protein IQ07DRAFT_557958 [Pyrenochaeta sp. DS3sAY3a]|nr:hypothetical protein IQ07DRAFT_557958 [Pyrenochaeta sp. DS3sAY3a]